MLVDLQLFLPQTNFRPLHCGQSVHQFNWVKVIKTNKNFYCFLFFIKLYKFLYACLHTLPKVENYNNTKVGTNQMSKSLITIQLVVRLTSISLILPTSRASKLKFSTIPFLNLPFGGSNLILLLNGYKNKVFITKISC